MARSAITTNKYSVKDYKFSACFDGTINAFIDSATDATNLNISTLTLSVKLFQFPNSASSYEGVIGLHNSGSPQMGVLCKAAGSAQYAYNDTVNGTIYSSVLSKFSQWVEVTLVISGTSLKMYLDGTQIISQTITALTGGYSKFNLGKIGYGTAQTMTGYLGRAILCNYAMTPTDVARYNKDGVVLNNGVAATPLIDWKFTEGTDSTCASTGSLALSGTLASGATWNRNVPSQKRKAIINRPYSILFPTTADYVDFGDNASYDVVSAFTAEAWYYLPSYAVAANNDFISKWDTVTTANQSFTFFITSTGLIRLRLYLVTGGGVTYDTGVILPKNKWCHLVASFNGTVISIYLDGRLIYTTTIAANTIQVGEGNLTLGSVTTTPRTSPTGQIALARLWGSALTTQQVEDLYFDNKIPTGAVMEALMTEGAGATVANTGSVGGTGAISGATWDTNSPGKARAVVGTNRTAVV